MHNLSSSQAPRPANSDHLSVSTSHSSQTASLNTPRPSASSAGRPSHPVTLESLLAAHSSAPDPIRSALEHVIADRNSFAVQNAQLWKLVEKQRTTTTQLNKDNDRIRSEREVYKSRLAAIGDSPDVILKSFKEKERHHKPSSGSRSNSSPNPTGPLVRHHSDESSALFSLFAFIFFFLSNYVDCTPSVAEMTSTACNGEFPPLPSMKFDRPTPLLIQRTTLNNSVLLLVVHFFRYNCFFTLSSLYLFAVACGS